jgi:hypothetical protein
VLSRRALLATLPGFAFSRRAVALDFGLSAGEPSLSAGDAQIDWSATPVLRVLGRMAATLNDSEYRHQTAVNERLGRYYFDCSGMVDWVLRRATPRAAAWVGAGPAGRPLARDYQRRIARVPSSRPLGGWRRVSRVAALQPGDVVAWVKPEIIASANTGHVAFVIQPPQPVPGMEGYFLVRIADSTSLLHDEDTREGRSGFGFGTILLVADRATWEPIAYGWAGLRWRSFETRIALGRPIA